MKATETELNFSKTLIGKKVKYKKRNLKKKVWLEYEGKIEKIEKQEIMQMTGFFDPLGITQIWCIVVRVKPDLKRTFEFPKIKKLTMNNLLLSMNDYPGLKFID